MAKGDHSRAQNKIDEQQQMGQSYLTGTQQNIGNQYGAYNNLFWGNGGAPTMGNTYGWGTTVPQYSQYGKPTYSGNQTDIPMYQTGASSYAPGDYASEFFSIFPKGSNITPQMLQAAAPQLAKFGMSPHANAEGVYGKVTLPNGQIADVMQNSGMGGGAAQFDLGMGGGGFGGGLPGMSMQDYAKIQGLYQGLLGNYGNLYGDLRGQYGNFIGSASNMAKTGGLSEQDKANLRARAISPIRSVYSQGLQDVERQRALQGGYSPGFGTLMGRFNRQMGQQTSDATTNAEAAIAELVQKGKLGGLSAWGSGLAGMGSGLLGALGGENAAIGGMGGLYGTEPGMPRLYGGFLQNQMANQLQAAGLQNQLGLGIMNAQNQSSYIPGNYQNALANIGGTMKLGQGVAGALSGLQGTNWWQNAFGGGYPTGYANGPISGEVYGGGPIPGGYTGDFSYAGATPGNPSGMYSDPGQYGLGTVPDYGMPPMDYSADQIYPWL
jgi:hypothetical protein